MNAWIQTVENYLRHSAYPGALVEVLVESLVVLLVAGGWCLLWRRAAAATRHLIWFLSVASLPLLLCLSILPHSWQKPLWSVSTGVDPGNQFLLSLTLAPVPGAGHSSSALPGETAGGVVGSPANSVKDRGFAARFSTSWLVVMFFLWAGGAALGLVSVLVGQVRLRQLARTARPLGTPDWELVAREAWETLRLHRRPTLLLAAEDLMPLTWGWWRPRVLVPAQAVSWPAERRRVVLLHELAHVKRWDCLTQTVARIICALVWVNPLVWVAARRMCIERERACDDLVLGGGCKPSEYATQLLEIARAFRPARYAAGIAMARSAHLQGRIAGIVDAARARKLHPMGAIAIFGFMSVLVGCVAGTSGKALPEAGESAALRQQQIAQLESFARVKEKQSQTLAAKAGETISPDFQRFFDAAIKGDWQTVTNRYEYFKRHHPQYISGSNAIERLRTAYWQPVLELGLNYDHVVNCEPKYTKLLADGIINSIPPGSIYFGGTDPGRGVPTAFEKSSIEGDPFFCLTQNALADGTYLEYLQAMYGGKIYTPTMEDSQKCFQEYSADATRRLNEKKLKPGEDVRMVDGQVNVSGQVAVMSINGLLTKVVFDRNPDREFYVEESFPLDWMYPYLEPHGLIMKINRKPQAQLSEEVIARDHDYWGQLVGGMIGDWLGDQTRVSELAGFVDRVYVHKNPKGFAGDPLFIRNKYSQMIFSKLRSSIAGVYAWRLSSNAPAEFKPETDAERQRLVHETDLAFRQAFALCPYSPEAVFRYVNFLLQFDRVEDARVITQAYLDVDPQNSTVRDLLRNIEKRKGR